MSRFFELLGARLRNVRWSWGAKRSDGAVFLRQWETDVTHENGREYVRIAHRTNIPGPYEHGWRERLDHIATIEAGAPCFLVMCIPQDPSAKPKSLKHFNAREIVIAGRPIRRGSEVLVEVLERRPVAEFIHHR